MRTAMLLRKLFALFEDKSLKRFRALASVKSGHAAIFFIAIFALALLTGCSGMRIVDSQVAAFSKMDALAAGSTWRFERLPSQENLEPAQAARLAKLEAVAKEQLAKFGFKSLPEIAGSVARFSVQISARIQRLERGPFDDPWSSYGMTLPGRDYAVTASGRVIYLPVFPRVESLWYVREVGLIIRDTSDNRVVFETKAQHEGRWSDDEAVLPAMFAAALQGFPKPPEGKRMVNIEIPR